MEYLNLNHLKSFYTVARFKSYSKASQNLHVQQPALSKTVKTLEEDLGVQLFQRVGRGVELTREGEYIYSRCHEIFAQVEQIKNYARNEDVPLKESITIVCSDLIATKVMPSLISELTPLYPAIRPIVSSGMSKEMLALIKDKKANLGLFFHLPKLPSGIKLIEEIELPFKLVISAREFHSQKVRNAFIGSREVDDPANMKFPTVEKMREHWPQTQIRFSSNSLLSHKEMVLKGMGVSILPYFFVKEEILSGQLRCLLEEEDFTFKLKVVGDRSKLGKYEIEILKLVSQKEFWN